MKIDFNTSAGGSQAINTDNENKISLRTITTHPYGYSICVTL